MIHILLAHMVPNDDELKVRQGEICLDALTTSTRGLHENGDPIPPCTGQDDAVDDCHMRVTSNFSNVMCIRLDNYQRSDKLQFDNDISETSTYEQKTMHYQKPKLKPLLAIVAALVTSLSHAQDVVATTEEAVRVVDAVESEPRKVTITPAAQSPAVEAIQPALFEDSGILTPRGAVVIEPSIQYVYASSNRVAVVGYTVIPALLLGLLDVREVRNNTLTGALTTRVGYGSRWDLEMRVPYVIRRDSTITRQIGQGADTDSAFNIDGEGIGDVEFAGRYQLNDGGRDGLYLIAGLRLKMRNGRDPFEVVTNCTNVCNGSSTGLQLEQPTGSGFYSLQPSLTWLLPSDPAVFFGGVSYAYNFKRDGVSRQLLNGQTEYIGDIEPGGVFGINFGMGLTLNEKSSFSIGFDLNSIGQTRLDGVALSNSVRTQLASLLLGYSYRYSPKRTINLSVSAGLTRDTPDLTLNLKVPFTL